ncbi:hypothetical protein PUN28_019885 [Cardiocondyla obscurior]|uniref:Secreted protein n=1 Tax=Cardiocondyla obscurior TaxID=286306 RepID=A0AAW2E7X8_9HYME
MRSITKVIHAIKPAVIMLLLPGLPYVTRHIIADAKHAAHPCASSQRYARHSRQAARDSIIEKTRRDVRKHDALIPIPVAVLEYTDRLVLDVPRRRHTRLSTWGEIDDRVDKWVPTAFRSSSNNHYLYMPRCACKNVCHFVNNESRADFSYQSN